MKPSTLSSGWVFRSASRGVGYWRPNQPSNPWRPAVVPGCIHDDLVRAGVIADPFTLEHEAGCQWVSEEDWEYATTFSWSPDPALPRRVLRFEGLDTVCAVFLNEEPLAEHDNMFLPLEVDVSDRLKEGDNELRIVFLSAVRVGMERRKAFFEANGIDHGTNWFDERSFVRKVQCMSGWDWGPRLVSCGIWKPVRLLEFSSRILSFDVFQEPLEGGRFRVWSETTVEGDAPFETEFDGKSFSGNFDLVVEEPQLWWPNGEGEPHLYSAKAKLESGDEAVRRIGLRTIKLVQKPDEKGVSFRFEVNDRPIYARGANWIPNDSFPSRISDEAYHRQIRDCASLNMNMLRVWGGGLYESEAFYDACDELGILVWQDFPFACSYYPDDEAFRAVIAREAEYHVRRLRHRASLALWCGNNENDVMWEGKWGGSEKSPPRYCGDDLYGKTLAEVCARLDPNRPYVRSSPIGGQKEGQAWGDTHYWDVWHGRGDWKFYGESLTRFCSEFGFASACGAPCWNRAKIDFASARRDDLSVRWHDKTNKPWEVYRDLVELHYPVCESLEDWTYYSQLNQRDALRFGIEHFRTSGYCMGTLIWQFNDCWPVQSWAVQDYARQLKVAGFELRRLYAPDLVSLRVEGDELIVSAANDGPSTREAQALTLQFFDMGGKPVQNMNWEVFDLGLGAPREVARVSLREFDRERTIVSCTSNLQDAVPTLRTLAEPKAMHWQRPVLSITEDLTLQVQGLAYDAIVDDPDAPGNVGWKDQSHPGIEARTLLNESVTLFAGSRPRRIRVRCLSGVQVLDVPSP